MIIGVKKRALGNEWRLIDFMRPSKEALVGLTYSDVASRLFNIKRFCGSGYSVMEHGYDVASMVPDRLRDAALMHDCVEMITGDIPSPIKRAIRFDDGCSFCSLEKSWQRCFFETLNIAWPSEHEWHLIDEADKKAGRAEAKLIGLNFDEMARSM